MGRKDEKLKSLLRKMEVSEPTDSFTDEVAKEIEAIVQNKVLANDNLKYLLQEHALTTPPSDFTYKIVDRARNHSTLPAYKSVISNRAWLIIASMIFVFSVEALVSKPVTEVSGISLYFISFGRYLNTLSLQFFEPLFFLGIIVISASLLLTLDFAFYRKYNSKANNEIS
jgi:hypothetical protein